LTRGKAQKWGTFAKCGTGLSLALSWAPYFENPPIYMFPCSDGNTSFYEMRKKQGNKKKVKRELFK
jgi:hypothetical protein